MAFINIHFIHSFLPPIATDSPPSTPIPSPFPSRPPLHDPSSVRERDKKKMDSSRKSCGFRGHNRQGLCWTNNRSCGDIVVTHGDRRRFSDTLYLFIFFTFSSVLSCPSAPIPAPARHRSRSDSEVRSRSRRRRSRSRRERGRGA